MKKKVIILLILLVILSFIPFPTVLSPEWKIRVVNEKNQPFVNVELKLTCNDYDTRTELCSERQKTDENGYVVFPKKLFWESLMFRTISRVGGFLLDIISAGHYSYGKKVYVSQIDTGKSLDYSPLEPIPDTIVVNTDEATSEDLKSKIRAN